MGERGPEGFGPADQAGFNKFYYDTERFAKSCLRRTAEGLMLGALGGAASATMDLAWYPDGKLGGHKGVVIPEWDRIKNWSWSARYFMRPMAIYGCIIAAYSAVDCIVEDMRGPDGKKTAYWNQMAGGAVAGAMVGASHGRIDITLATAAGTALVLGFFGFAQHMDLTKEERAVNYEVEVEVNEHTLKEKYPEYKNL